MFPKNSKDSIIEKTTEIFTRVRIFHMLYVKRMKKLLEWQCKYDPYSTRRKFPNRSSHLREQLISDIHSIKAELDYIYNYPINNDCISINLLDKYWLNKREVDTDVNSFIPLLIDKIVEKGFKQMTVILKLMEAVVIEFMDYLGKIYLAISLEYHHKRHLTDVNEFDQLMDDVISKIFNI